jgi:hypothetical protein
MIVNYDWKLCEKKLPWFNLRPYPGICHEDVGRPRKTGQERRSVSAEMRIWHSHNVSQKRYNLNLFARSFRPKLFLTRGLVLWGK